MAYTTVTVKGVDRNADGRIVIHLLHEGDNNEQGVQQVVEVGNATSLSATYLRDLARERQGVLNANLTFRATANGFINTVLNLTPPTPPTPTAAEIARDAFLVLYRRLQASQRAIAVGMFNATDPTYVTLLAQTRAAWLPQYLSVV